MAAAVWLVSVLVGSSLGTGSVPEWLPAVGAALVGWAGAQVAVSVAAWHKESGAHWPRSLALGPTLVGAAGVGVLGASGALDRALRAPWPVWGGLALGVAAAACLVCLVRRHGERVLVP